MSRSRTRYNTIMKRLSLLVGMTLALMLGGAALVTQANRPEMLAQETAAVRTGGGGAVRTVRGGVLTPGPDDATIAPIVARILAQQHYSQKPMDDAVSSRFLDRYLEALDPLRFYFLESDIAEFEKWRNELDDLTWKRGDTTPATVIATRFLERLDQQNAYVNELLKTEKFTFDGNDTFVVDREKEPRPKDLDDAKRLWRDRVRYEYLQEKLNKQKPEEIVKTVTRRYARLSRSAHELDSGDILQIYLTSLAHVYDPHSDYLGKASLANFDISMKLSLFGVGAQLQSEDGYTKIMELTPGGPALKSGQIKPGDRIVAVAQDNGEPVDVVDMKIDKVVEMIRGPKGTRVNLTLLPADAADPSVRKVVTLVRDEVKLEDRAATARIVDMPNGAAKTVRVGVIELPSFYADTDTRRANRRSTTTDVARLIGKLKTEKAQGLILDLRNNGGGSLEEAINLTGLFIKEGPVVQVRDPEGGIEVDRDTDPSILYGGPLVVLINRGSASASEILAGALQDYGRALIVGDTSTHGKGTVQTIYALGPVFQQRGIRTAEDPGALKVTIRKFYRANGSSTQLRGVTPDIVLPSLTSVLRVGEASLFNPLPWDTIAPARYQKVNAVTSLLPALRKRSEARVATNKDFLFLRGEIDRLKKLEAQKTVSLNERQRLKEKREAEARVQARSAELKARPASLEKVYPLTLSLVNKPGLPPAQTGKPAAAPVRAAEGDGAPPAEAAVPPVDTTLIEGKRILADMIALSAKPAPATAQR